MRQSVAKKPGKLPPQPKGNKKPTLVVQPPDQNLFEDFHLDPHQETIVSLIQEYLLKYNLLNTLDILQRELLSGRAVESVHLEGDLLQVCSWDAILQLFERGEQELFFVQWNKYLPYNLRMKDESAKKLEFYIQIYFLIYEIHPKTGKKNGVMGKNTVTFFKSYLESRGQELSKTNEFLPYYALPYVPRPQEHASYKHLFSNQWILEIKGKLVKLMSDLTSRDHTTVVEQMYHQYTQDDPQQRKTVLYHYAMHRTCRNPTRIIPLNWKSIIRNYWQ